MEPLQIEQPPETELQAAENGVLIHVNGYPAVDVRPYTGRGETRAVEVEDRTLQNLLVGYSLQALQQQFWSVGFIGNVPNSDLFQRMTIEFWDWLENPDPPEGWKRQYVRSTLDPPLLQFCLAEDVADWTSPWTPREYSHALQKVSVSRAIDGFEFDLEVEPSQGFWFNCVTRGGLACTLGEELCYWSDMIRAIKEEANARLLAAQHANSLTTSFHFPPEIATACEQYIVYFVQFLADLGIKAEAQVQHKAAEVLFRVTPVDGPEVLERIRVALDAYLRFPTDRSFAIVAAEETDLAVRQLEANVFHLQGQLSIAKAVLQAKDAQIEALELSNFRLRQISGGEVQALDGGKEGSTTPAVNEDTEAIIPGVVSVKEVEKGGFVFHTPEILRKLKRWRGGRAEER